MDAGKLTIQALEFNRAAFDQVFNAVAAVQDQAEGLINLWVEQSPWFPTEGKDAIRKWENPYRKSRETLKAAVDEGYKRAESMLASI